MTKLEREIMMAVAGELRVAASRLKHEIEFEEFCNEADQKMNDFEKIVEDDMLATEIERSQMRSEFEERCAKMDADFELECKAMDRRFEERKQNLMNSSDDTWNKLDEMLKGW